MKRTKPSSLLTAAAAFAGVAMGAGIALAAQHPAIQLYTYEEVAQQYGQLAMPVMVDPTSKQGFPYSPKQTCSGAGNLSCHSEGNTAGLKSYSQLADHAFHAALGYNEWHDNDPSGLFISPTTHDVNGTTINQGTQTGLAASKPWLQSHGHNGKW